MVHTSQYSEIMLTNSGSNNQASVLNNNLKSMKKSFTMSINSDLTKSENNS